MERSRPEDTSLPTLVSCNTSQSIPSGSTNNAEMPAVQDEQQRGGVRGADLLGGRGGVCGSGRSSDDSHGGPLQDISTGTSSIDVQPADEGRLMESAHCSKTSAAAAPARASATTVIRPRNTRNHKPQPIDTSSLRSLSRAYSSAYNAAVSPVGSPSSQRANERDATVNGVSDVEGSSGSRNTRIKKGESSNSSQTKTSPTSSHEEVQRRLEHPRQSIGSRNGKNKKTDGSGDQGELKEACCELL
jgi:hypothetical protein